MIRTVPLAVVAVFLAAWVAAIAALPATPPPPRLTVSIDGGPPVAYVPASQPATRASVDPPDPPPVVAGPPEPEADVLYVDTDAGLAAAVAQMANGKTLALRSGRTWTAVVEWRWSDAKLIAYGDGPRPTVGGIRLAGPCARVLFSGVNLRGAGTGYGVDWRLHRTEDVRFEDMDAVNFATAYSVHVPGVDAAPVDQWHRGIAFYRCRAADTHSADVSNTTTEGQGWFVANVIGLTMDGCHADQCGNPRAAGMLVHGGYIAWPNQGVTLRGLAATRCESYGWQVRAPNPTVENCVAYDCGMGIMLSGPGGTVRDNVVILGHGHTNDRYGKGGFDLHMGGGDIRDNLVVNGPGDLPKGYYRPPAFNVGYRKTLYKLDKAGRPIVDPLTGAKVTANAPWEWTAYLPDGVTRRPLAKLGPNNLDRAAVRITLDVDSLRALPPAAVAARIAGAARSAAKAAK